MSLINFVNHSCVNELTRLHIHFAPFPLDLAEVVEQFDIVCRRRSTTYYQNELHMLDSEKVLGPDVKRRIEDINTPHVPKRMVSFYVYKHLTLNFMFFL